MAKITHRKIAELAGVSQSSVSKALSGSHEISAEVQKRIMEIAAANGYFDRKKDKPKRCFGKAQIAIMVPEIISYAYANEVTLLLKLLQENDAEGRIYVAGFEQDGFDDTVRQITENDYIDGVISFFDAVPEKEIGIPYICTTQFNVNLQCNSVSSDLVGGFRQAVTHLTELGHTRIGFIGEANTRRKEQIFTDTMKAFDLDPHYIYTNEYRFEMCGYNGILQMLDSEQIYPTALICAYDEIAYGAINELKLYGYNVPRDFSVIGINDVTFSKVLKPELTTICLHSDAMCAEVVKLLEDCLFGDQKKAKQIEVQCDIKVRQSTAAVRRELLI